MDAQIFLKSRAIKADADNAQFRKNEEKHVVESLLKSPDLVHGPYGFLVITGSYSK